MNYKHIFQINKTYPVSSHVIISYFVYPFVVSSDNIQFVYSEKLHRSFPQNFYPLRWQLTSPFR